MALLCPRLQRLQIESVISPFQPEPISILKIIVKHCAEYGSPLKGFTFLRARHSKFELIGKDGSFTMEAILLAEAAGRFTLKI